MKTIGLVLNRDKPAAWTVARKLVDWIEVKGARVVLESEDARALGRPDVALPRERFPDAVDLLFVLGGDGTLLGYAREFAPHKIPLLGINVGRLGFLSEAEPDDLPAVVDRVLRGDYSLDERMMLEAQWVRDGTVRGSYLALNDVGVAREAFSRMITTTVFVDGVFLSRFSGDGLVVATPTGSTAYSLSAGGPIIVPHLDAILLTPVAPHTLTARPMVLAPQDEVCIRVDAPHAHIGLTVDGQLGVRLEPGDEVRVRRAPHTTLLIKWKERAFFDVVRRKLQGDPPRGDGL